jgi:hypothetical protein
LEQQGTNNSILNILQEKTHLFGENEVKITVNEFIPETIGEATQLSDVIDMTGLMVSMKLLVH